MMERSASKVNEEREGATRALKGIVVVDLDGTLFLSDMLVENLFLFLRLYPLRIFEMIAWLFNGKAYFKRRLADAVVPDVSQLPYNKDLVAWLKNRRNEGASLILATATDMRIAKKIAEHLNIFDEVLGTESNNLSSDNKREALVQRYGEKGYEYVGNSSDDLAVWKSASVIHVANPDRGVLAAARRIGQVQTIFESRLPYLRTLIRALRIHQWAKNLLVFVPLLASHRIMEMPLLQSGLLAFLAFGACASSVYLLNDLLDLQEDRLHSTKRSRPLAAGTLPILHALFLIPVLLFGAFIVALLLLPIRFAGVLTVYYILTLAYSFWLKRVVMLDVVTLAMLYTVRVVAGAAAMFLMATFWILAFCMFIFLSLAFLKRYTELRDARQKGKKEESSGRGYYPADFELLASLGGASGYISVLVLALYIRETASGTLYRSQEWMWAACPLLLFWLSRVWLLAHRGEMHDDPIVFALRDGVSRWVGIAFVIVFALATF
ncbi:MAG: UbiA family prenyltransferase [Candidatus Manganitrophus sp.]|nr:UbiA family prenyltransferase [Candidatus Manganitrophus sp.]MDC4223266.1 UbiA family prenyltransferase [Candidatus Manganitrophus sp.]WDT71632.1 MAG: UbiA family prenyltransferase [Candidatus Manganitrophus sp.]WDT76118.1 MAG: UbiA family prenyltransferase [Candidatus Manganitrophus sp.]WDT81020.1 MAG: UbiA family prenyltransferase [Candidatus Manganitrophus sp.]